MEPRPSYITLINEFWARYQKGGINQREALAYLYVLHRINLNRWEKVAISDKRLADGAGCSQGYVFKLKPVLIELGIKIETKRVGRSQSTFYSLKNVKLDDSQPTSQPPILGCEKISQPISRPNIGGCEVGCERDFHIILDNKTKDIRPTTTEGAQEVLLEEAPAEKFLPSKIEQKTDAEIDLETTAQTAEVRRRFFAPESVTLLEQFCMGSKCDPAELRELTDQVLAEWQLTQTRHTAPDGTLDYGAAVRHLLNTVRVKLRVLRKEQRQGGSREERRANLYNAAVRQMRDAIENPGHRSPDGYDGPEDQRPF